MSFDPFDGYSFYYNNYKDLNKQQQTSKTPDQLSYFDQN